MHVMAKRKMITGNSELMRNLNRTLIIKTIMERGKISRSEIENFTSLTMPTVMRIVESLMEEGLVIEVGKGSSSGGRRPTMLQMNPSSMYFIGVSVRRVLIVVLTDVSGNIISRYECHTKYDDTTETVLEQILHGFDHVIRSSGVNPSKLVAASIGLPGTKFKHKSLKSEYPFDNWANFDKKSWVDSAKFPCPVEIENIARLGALGELVFGIGQKERNFIYIFVDYGVGSGSVVNGKLFTGNNGVAGELGHMVINDGGYPCYCGNKGCLEMYCSTFAIINNILSDQKADPKLVQKLRLNKDFNYVIKAAHQGDELATRLIKDSARMLGIGISNIINLLNPAMIILGGELPDNYPEYMKISTPFISDGIFRNLANDVLITPSKLGNNSQVMGAVALAMAKVFDHMNH